MYRLIIIIFFSAVYIHCQAQNDICFRVDVNKPVEIGLFEASSGDRVILRGSFNNWQGDDYVLYDQDGDNIYSGTFLIEGDPETGMEYKFIILKASGKALWEKNPNPENPPNGNRTFILTGESQEFQPATYHFDKYYLALTGKEVFFSVEEMQQDFSRMRQTLENEHCCLYEYTPKEILDSLFQYQYNLITRPLQPHEFYNILSPITAKIGCMHTAVWMPGGYWDMQPDNLFPYGRYAEFAQPIPMAENHFSGNLFTLLDGYCGSTNGHFCALLKYNKIGKIVGTPSGATYKCNAGRNTEITLDHSRIILTFGRSTFAAAVTGMDKSKPVMPDYPVQVTYQDFLNGRDVFMKTALMLINGQKDNN